jgi:hypothetical protein
MRKPSREEPWEGHDFSRAKGFGKGTTLVVPSEPGENRALAPEETSWKITG